jgi:hypothetical protein
MDPIGDIGQRKFIAEAEPHLRTPQTVRLQVVKSKAEETSHIVESRDIQTDVFSSSSHVVRLPPELVSEIFLATPFEDRAAMRKVYLQICSVWRRIAISTPRLWTTISLVLIEHKFDTQMSYIRTLCERAGQLPVSISLYSDDNHSLRAKCSINQNPIPTLTPYVSRIKDLSLSLSETGAESFYQLPEGSLPLLESCAIEVYANDEIVGRFFPTTALKYASRLRRLSLDDKWGDPSLLRLPSHLVYLCIKSALTPSNLIDILRQCPNLEELAQVKLTLSAPNYAGDVIALPRLRGLDFCARRPWHPNDTFFQRFTVPSLRELKLLIEDDGALLPMSLKTLLLQSSCPLERLSLSLIQMDPEILLDCLRAVPSLVMLAVLVDGPNSAISARLLLAMTFVPGNLDNLVPKLQAVSFLGSPRDGDNNSADEQFINMVESRWWLDVHGVDYSDQMSRLITAKFYNCDRHSPTSINARRRIDRLRREGLGITLR